MSRGLIAFRLASREPGVDIITDTLTGNIEQVKSVLVGKFVFPFSADEPDDFYQINLSCNEQALDWRVVYRAMNGFELALTVNGEPCDPPSVCVVTVDR